MTFPFPPSREFKKPRGLEAAAAFIALGLLSGCASFGEGVTNALLDRGRAGPEPDTRQCEITGPDFPGLADYLEAQTAWPPLSASNDPARPITKLLMVHGIGEHHPGYAGGMLANLTEPLGLTVAAPQTKEILIQHPDFPGETLGQLNVQRVTDADRQREFLFFELTWSRISDPARAAIRFDNSEAFARKRAGFNRAGKSFLNQAAPDPLVYVGVGRERILTSVLQSMCWAYSADWQGLPEGPATCAREEPAFLSRVGTDTVVFATHSLGSRVMTDALQTIPVAISAEVGSSLARSVQAVFETEEPQVFMLSNQLPLLQSGFPPPRVAGETPLHCTPGAAKFDDKLFARTRIVAFSDPNDLVSYPIPDAFVQSEIDSRLCPSVTNVLLNIVPVLELAGVVEFANPLQAHLDYENDERVIALMTHGLGQPGSEAMIGERCSWTEIDESLR